VRFTAANISADEEGRLAFGELNYGQDGLPRRVAQGTPAASRFGDRWGSAAREYSIETERADDGLQSGQRPGAARSATQIHINVQAMDSRSFLDHSDDIARAVREAMLNMHALNDVLNEI
jgi:hypothetical protein